MTKDKMTQEKETLSDKETIRHGDIFYYKEDVKEAIKKLKDVIENIIKQEKPSSKLVIDEHSKHIIREMKFVLGRIDEIFGEKLSQ